MCPHDRCTYMCMCPACAVARAVGNAQYVILQEYYTIIAHSILHMVSGQYNMCNTLLYGDIAHCILFRAGLERKTV